MAVALHSFDPNRPAFAPYGLTCERWAPVRMHRPDRHNEIELNLLRAGRLTYLLGGRRVTVPSSRLTVFWAAIPHQIIRATSSVEYIVATLPLAQFMQFGLSESFVRRILGGEVVVESDRDAARFDVPIMERWVADLESDDSRRERVVTLEMEARMRRFALGQGDGRRRSRPAPLSAEGISKVERMAVYVAEHYRDEIAVGDVARDAGLHPNYAMGMFRKVFGLSITAQVNSYRLSHAQRLLLTTTQSIAQIAFASGFGSLSRFNQVFRESAGCTPRQYRRRQGRGIADQSPPDASQALSAKE